MAGPKDTLTIARSYSQAISAQDWDRLRNEVLAPDVEAWSHSAQYLEHGPEEIISALQKTTGAVSAYARCDHDPTVVWYGYSPFRVGPVTGRWGRAEA